MYPFPELERERIIALRAAHIMDSGPDPEFDAVVELLRDLFEVPISLVSLVDTDRQWFKAKCGIDLDATERASAFCNYTILSDEVLVVEDVTQDLRFKDSPLVTDGIFTGFYAGAPLLVGPGVALGTLCVADKEPRRFSASDARTLERLAKVVTGLIRGHGSAQEAKQAARESEAQSALVREQARDLRIRERRFLQTERLAKLGGWEFDIVTGVLAWSDELYRTHEVPVGTPLALDAVLAGFPSSESVRLQAVVHRTLEHGIGFDEEFYFDTKSGIRKWIRMMGDVEVHDGTPRRLFGMVHDVSERHRTEARLWTVANIDSLTGLANRNRFDHLLDSAFATPGSAPGMLMVDADHLKEVNDTLGHDAGDAVIQAVALRLTEAVGSAGTVARIDGDELAVLVTAPVTSEGLAALSKSIVDAMRPPVVFKGTILKPSVSVGGSLGSSEDGPEVLRQSVDLALYHAKAHCRGDFVLFHDGLKSAITARIAAVNTVDHALTSGDVRAWYQPVVDLVTGQVTGFEALARICRGDDVLSIGAFAHALQDRRTATRLTARMFDRIAADVLEWRAAGLTIPRIAFNVGPLDFQEGAIESMLLSTCASAGLQPSDFTMEVTESVFLSRDAGIVADTAARLRERGVTVALDDFGTGHASLAHLGTFPVDVIKMDRSFVMRMSDSRPGYVIAAALIDLAHKLGIQVIAEGIESEAQLGQLRALGCERAQGYLFSRPLPATAVIAFGTSVQTPRRARTKRRPSVVAAQ